MQKKFHMLDEIREQPAILERAWNRRNEIAALAKEVSGARLVVLTAFGSSFHAALHGQALFMRLLGIPAITATPSFFLEHGKRLDLRNSLVIAISQSGKVEEVIAALRALKREGGKTIGITNDPDSRLAASCHFLLPLEAGKERSVPATKTFTATLYAIQILTACLAQKNKPLLRALAQVPETAGAVLGREREMEKLARALRDRSRCLLLAPEALRPVAQEGGLKLKECAYVMADHFEWREFFHGPVALMERETPAILLRHPGDPEMSAQVESRVKKAGRFVYPVSVGESLPARDESLLPVGYAILFQLLAFHLALEKKINPDTPRRLHKVVRTSV